MTPLQFMQRYRNLKVKAGEEDRQAMMTRQVFHRVQLRQYFMMDWDDDSDEREDFNEVTSGPRTNSWLRAHKPRILNAAMGKGSPEDYELALEWAVRSGKVRDVTRANLQTFCDDRLGIDCSGFATNYLIARGTLSSAGNAVRNRGASSYFNLRNAVTDPGDIRQGDLLVWMSGNRVKTNPGHIAVVQQYRPQSMVGGNLHVVEATGSRRANPKLVDSMYTVERIQNNAGGLPIMVLQVKRFGRSGSRVTVMRY